MFADKISTAVRSALLAASAFALIVPVSEAVAGPLSWIRGERVQGNGHIVKQEREVAHFSALALSTGAKVEVRLGGAEGVTVETDDNIMPVLETVVEGSTLHIRPAKKNMQLETRNMRIVVQARNLQSISVGGSGSVDAAGLSGNKLSFEMGGSGSIVARDVKGRKVSVSLGGSGSVKTTGAAEDLEISIGGSGEVHAGDLAVREASVSIGGSGDATVNANKSLNVSVAGSGDVGYYGDPQISKTVVGSGGVKRLGASRQ
ncbi:head GIN domain-containing protein [Massilia endophytica]|uniref:head GIN domain-containing protein n=1 Tax=Massilia endophytica TaxID=2899220 RepID=UPI001E3A42FF|nr:head GIN domain-containing protein [Massilia endophytica]UGQ47903.1 DUF2807 domain-containing protein [Massilia endophytica]